VRYRYQVLRIRICIGSIFSSFEDPDPGSVFRMWILDPDPLVKFRFVLVLLDNVDVLLIVFFLLVIVILLLVIVDVFPSPRWRLRSPRRHPPVHWRRSPGPRLCPPGPRLRPPGPRWCLPGPCWCPPGPCWCPPGLRWCPPSLVTSSWSSLMFS